MRYRLSRRRLLPALAAIAMVLAVPATFDAQFDICGCANIPDLQPFDSANSATWPPGTTISGSTINFTLPEDGIFRFSSFTAVNRYFTFSRNAANTPVTILVSGNMTLTGTGCCYTWQLSGSSGTQGSSATAGVGGLGGPGGFRGGDGASQGINLAAIGGSGFGPGGGAAGTSSPLGHAAGGTFVGLPELLPLIGGAGGGGGASSATNPTNCSGGGGGGGGGALLIAVNGTLQVQNYQLFADGGSAGAWGNTTCATYGGGGSGGAIRLVAGAFSTPGFAQLLARAGSSAVTGAFGGPGRIRLESVNDSAQTLFSTDPAAQRIVGPTPLTNPVSPTVRFVLINGAAVPEVTLGTYGGIDVVVPAPGATTFTLETTGIPSGTTVEVTVKPRIGAAPQTQTVPIVNCNTAGVCETAATFNLVAGAYVAEARATFQVVQ
jgi:hypothetical protein